MNLFSVLIGWNYGSNPVSHLMKKAGKLVKKLSCFLVHPAWAQSYGSKSLVGPSSGKDIANGKVYVLMIHVFLPSMSDFIY